MHTVSILCAHNGFCIIAESGSRLLETFLAIEVVVGTGDSGNNRTNP
jgi:hypothetical protein